MLGCLKGKYKNCIFIRERLTSWHLYSHTYLHSYSHPVFTPVFTQQFTQPSLPPAFIQYMTRVVRKSPSSGLKNRVILAYWKLLPLVEMLKNACMFGVKRSRNSLGNQKISAWKDAHRTIIVTPGWVNLSFQPQRGRFSHNTSHIWGDVTQHTVIFKTQLIVGGWGVVVISQKCRSGRW